MRDDTAMHDDAAFHVIRDAVAEDADALSALIGSTSLACCFDAAHPCPDWYLERIGPERIRASIGAPGTAWFVAVREGHVLGVLAIADARHVRYFFVDPALHRTGVGGTLWRHATRRGAIGRDTALSVRSSLVAVPVHERLGFRADGPAAEFRGMAYLPMTRPAD